MTFSVKKIFFNVVFRFVAYVTKKLQAILVVVFYTDRTFYRSVFYSLNYLSLKFKIFQGDSVKNGSARAKKRFAEKCLHFFAKISKAKFRDIFFAKFENFAKIFCEMRNFRENTKIFCVNPSIGLADLFPQFIH